MTKLHIDSVRRAIEHIVKYGDTDVFPHLCETTFLRECKEEIAVRLAGIELDTFEPAQALESLTPKSRYGFRVAHQLQPLETTLLTASLIQIGPDLEKLKSPAIDAGPFAYRFREENEPSLFKPDSTYRNWLKWQKEYAEQADFAYVIFTDIADFFQRIYIHRLENTLDVATADKGIKRFVEKTVKAIRSRQSYGIPVGGSAARLLAEVVLTDTDAALADQGLRFSRFVDDYRIFVDNARSPYEALSFLAEQLFASEGLTLNGAKTLIMTRAQYIEHLTEDSSDFLTKAEANAFEILGQAIYFDEEPEKDLVNQIRGINLIEMLEKEIAEETWDFGKIKALLKALRIASVIEAADMLIERMPDLLPFSKEIAIYFSQALLSEDQRSRLTAKVIECLKSTATKSVPTINVWLLELFVRGTIAVSNRELSSLEFDNILVERQHYLIRGLNSDVNFFRRKKTQFDMISDFAKTPFLLGASCLPKDEYDTWVRAVKGRMIRPLDDEFCAWVRGKNGKLRSIITTEIADLE